MGQVKERNLDQFTEQENLDENYEQAYDYHLICEAAEIAANDPEMHSFLIRKIHELKQDKSC